MRLKPLVMNKQVYFLLFLISSLSAFAQQGRKIDSLQKILGHNIEDTNRVKALSDISKSYLYNEPQKAFVYAKEVGRLSEKINWAKGKGLAYNCLGSISLVRSNYDSAAYYFREGLRWARISKNRKLEGYILNNLGLTHNRKYEYDSALYYYRNAVKLNREGKNKYGESSALNNMGDTYYAMSDYSKSLDYYFQALKINTESGNDDLRSGNIANISSVYFKLNDEKNALKYAFMASDIYKKTGNKLFEASNYGQIASIYHSSKDFKKALEFNQKAKKLYQEMGDEDGLAVVISNIGNLYLDDHHAKKALEYYAIALPLSKKVGNKNCESSILDNMASAYTQLGDYKQVVEYENEALILARQTKNLYDQHTIWANLSMSYEKMHLPALALDAYKKSIVLRDSIINVDKQKELTRKQMQFDFDISQAKEHAAQDKKNAIASQEIQKERLQRNGSIAGGIILILLAISLYAAYRQKKKNNDILTIQKEILQQQKSEIEKRDKEKELLLRELHHRVKNNLQIVSSLLSLQSDQIVDDKSREAFREGQSRVEAMSLIHQRLYLGDKFSKIDMHEYLQNLVRSVSNSYGYNQGSFKLEFNVEQMDLDVELAIPLGLIVNEILSNCFKHAFKSIDEPRLQLAMQKSGDILDLKIADNGAGIPANMSSGKSGSFGMKMINSLTDQISGTLSILNTEGSIFEFQIPLDKNFILSA